MTSRADTCTGGRARSRRPSPVLWIAALAASVPLARVDAQESTRFTVRIENTSGGSDFPGPFAPGAWAVHSESGVLFDVGAPDDGRGLEALAEDGGAAGLGEALAADGRVLASGVFTTPVGEEGPGPAFPGSSYEFTFEASADDDPMLSLATMLVRTNDIFAAPSPGGLALFDESGEPLSGDVTGGIEFWDAGTERDGPPGMGPNQAPLQSGPDTGPREGVVARFDGSTRGLPLADRVVSVAITAGDGEVTFRVTNVSAESGAIVTPIAPVFWAVHDESYALFESGGEASPGLEMLAEDGGPGGLVGEAMESEGVGAAGAQPLTDERPDAEPGPAMPGESYTFTVPLDVEHPRLTIAAMVVESNDVFFAFHPGGLPLFTPGGEPRTPEMLAADVERMLALWDAGSEMNEAPGAGPNQPLRQGSADTGPDDPVPGVRLYADATNDIAGPLAGGFVDLEVEAREGGAFRVTLRNTSGETSFHGVLSPVAWAIHDASASFFAAGEPASEGIERLAEDGDASVLAGALAALDGVAASGVMAVADGAEGPGPIFPGGSYTFEVMPTAEHPYLSIASMVVPSNDTFVAFGPSGIRLVAEDGTPRSEEMILAEAESELVAWDAGTELNQAGAAGPDQAPRQSGPDTGADEGGGIVRLAASPVWSLPAPSHVLRVTISAAMDGDVVFLRGDANQDGARDVSDAMHTLNYLFLGDDAPGCLDALDADDSGSLNVTDPVYVVSFLFLGGTAPPSPLDQCGVDPTDDGVGCESFTACSL